MRAVIVSIVYAFLLCAVPLSGHAESFLVTIEKQQEHKEQSRWTLAGWMAQKEKIRLMDQWLALNTNEIGLEVSLFGQSLKYSEEAQTDRSSGSYYEAQAIYKFFGLGANQTPTTQNSQMTTSYVMFRLLGTSQQSTHISFLWGQSTWKEFSGKNKVGMIGANMSVYLSSFLGINMSTEHYGDSNYLTANSFKGRSSASSLFIESGFIRVFYRAYKLEINSTGGRMLDTGSGIGLGLMF